MLKHPEHLPWLELSQSEPGARISASGVPQPCGSQYCGKAADGDPSFDCTVRLRSVAASFYALSSRRRLLGSEALKILEQFIQLKGVADGVHDSVLQH